MAFAALEKGMLFVNCLQGKSEHFFRKWMPRVIHARGVRLLSTPIIPGGSKDAQVTRLTVPIGLGLEKSSLHKTKRAPDKSGAPLMEAAGIEPASRNISTRASTCVADLFPRFRLSVPNQQGSEETISKLCLAFAVSSVN